MVKLNRIYTRTGDAGETGLARGGRRVKNDARIEAIGAVDEANAAIGVACCCTGKKSRVLLQRIQQDLFDLGADVATLDARPALRITAAQVTRLEQEIDAMNARLAPLRSFILPGGEEAAALLHLARTIVRRAERRMVTLMAQEKLNPAALQYINRLSDHLFVLARVENDKGKKDVLWQPGVNQTFKKSRV